MSGRERFEGDILKRRRVLHRENSRVAIVHRGYAASFTRAAATGPQQPDVHATLATNMALCSLSAGVLNAGITVRYYGHFTRASVAARTQTGTAVLRASAPAVSDGKTAGSLSTLATFALSPVPRRISLQPKGTRVGRREILPHDQHFMDGNDTRERAVVRGRDPGKPIKSTNTQGPRMIINSRQTHARRFMRPFARY